MIARCIAVMACLLLAGCATPRMIAPHLDSDTAMIAPGVVFRIPSLQTLDKNANIAQQVVAHFRDQVYAFDVQIQISPQELDLAALDGMGRRALTVSWKPGAIEAKAAPWLPPFVRPTDILADIAIVYWPRDALKSSFANSGITIANDGGRKLLAGKRELVVVTYGDGEGWNRSAKFRNLALGYEIDIQSAQLPP